ncbi:MAG: 2-dehydropantoate 2-reductase [Candidatus Tumulicola sp.]
MRIAVIGAGAIGGFVAAALARAGVAVGVVARGTHLEAIRRDGLHVRSDLGSFDVRVEAAEDVRALGSFDALVLAFKSHQWEPSLLQSLSDPRYSGATIVTLQNGVPFWYVRRPALQSVDPGGVLGGAFDDERIVGGVVHVSGRVEAPGSIVQSGGLRYVLGAVVAAAQPRVAAIASLMRDAGLQAEIDDDIRAIAWLKLVNNVGLNSVSTLEDASIRTMLGDERQVAEVRRLMHETLDVGRAMGVVADADIDARIAYAARLDDVRTSMLQDLRSDKPLEIDPMLGAVVELAGRYGVDVPHVRAAYHRLQRLSAPASRD